MNELKEIIKDFYEYTTSISITEFELFSNYYFIENEKNGKVKRNDYIQRIYKDILYDFIFNPKEIENQIENDFHNYDIGSNEIKYIKQMYKKCKNFIDIYIKDLED